MRKASGLRLAVAIVFLLVGCAYRVLPGGVPERGSGPLRLSFDHGEPDAETQKGRLLLPTGVEDVNPFRVFAARGSLLYEATRPELGLWVSRDEGRNWRVVPVPANLSEILVDGTRLYARDLRTLWRSDDGGGSWSRALGGGAEIESVTVSSDGQLLVGAGGRIYSAINGRGLRPLAIQGADSAQFRSVAAVRQNILASVRGPESKDLLNAVREMAGGHASEASAALDSKTAVSFGGANIYLSHDGGAFWKKTSLGMDAWLVEHEGAVYAIAADPLLEAAGLMRKSPGLAHALDRQLHDQRVDADDVRTALPWPGREELLRGSFPLVFRTTDAGEHWERVSEVPYEVRVDVFRQQANYPAERFIPVQSAPVLSQPGRKGREQPRPAPERITPRVTAETLLTFLDPLRLMALQNHAPLLGFAGSGRDRWAYLPTEEQWLALSAAVVAGTSAEGEIWTGTARPTRGPAVELLRSTDGGQSFAQVPGLPDAWPTSIAAGPNAAYFTLRGMGAYRVVP
jgi:photosystem II stability/assembly factor-like uncharacterized protein